MMRGAQQFLRRRWGEFSQTPFGRLVRLCVGRMFHGTADPDERTRRSSSPVEQQGKGILIALPRCVHKSRVVRRGVPHLRALGARLPVHTL